MLERSLAIVAALRETDLTRSELKDVVLQPGGERYTWHRWQPALGLLRHFGLIEVRQPSRPENPRYGLTTAASGVLDEESLKSALLAQAKARRGQLSKLQFDLLGALVNEGGHASIEQLRKRLEMAPDRGLEQVYQAVSDLAAQGLVVEQSELPANQPVIRLANEGWIVALEEAPG